MGWYQPLPYRKNPLFWAFLRLMAPVGEGRVQRPITRCGMLWYKITVRLWCGDTLDITTTQLEATILAIEDWFGDALEGYSAVKAEDYRIRGGVR